MPFMPFNIIGMWFKGLLSIAVLAGGIYLLRQWYEDSHVIVPETVVEVAGGDGGPARRSVPGHRVFRFSPGWNRETGELAAALALLTWAFAGQFVYAGVMALTLKSGSGGKPGSGDEDPKSDRGGEVQRLRRPNGAELHVECYGPPDAPPVLLTHGWGVNSTEWYYIKTRLADRFRVIVWDLPGLGLSKKPDDNDFRLETLAADLGAVLAATAKGQPTVLVGHSIGGMIALTFCKLFPESLGPRVSGLALVHTTYTNPVRTTKGAAIYTALEKPVLVPLMYLTIGLWPLVWLMNWMSYLNGSAHRSTHKQSFAGNETRGQLDFAARFMPHARPDVLARGMLAMLKYDATATLATIPVPAAVVPGDLDNTCPPDASEFMARSIPRADLTVLSPARHAWAISNSTATSSGPAPGSSPSRAAERERGRPASDDVGQDAAGAERPVPARQHPRLHARPARVPDPLRPRVRRRRPAPARGLDLLRAEPPGDGRRGAPVAGLEGRQGQAHETPRADRRPGSSYERRRFLATTAEARAARFSSARRSSDTARSWSTTPLGWRDAWRDGETRDVHADMMGLTLAIVAKTLFDAEVDGEAGDVGHALDVMMVYYLNPMKWFRVREWLPTKQNRDFRAAVRRVDEVVYGIIRRRRAGGHDPGDLLSRLLAAQDDEGAGMTDRQLRDECVTLFLAGHETTALTLTYTFHLLALNPDAEARLSAELDDVLGADRLPTAADMPRLTYTGHVVRESMRLYPPAWAIGREVVEPFEVGGYHVAKGTQLLISQWVLHRDPRWFDDPESFRPERWEGDLIRRLPERGVHPVRRRPARLRRQPLRDDGGRSHSRHAGPPPPALCDPRPEPGNRPRDHLAAARGDEDGGSGATRGGAAGWMTAIPFQSDHSLETTSCGPARNAIPRSTTRSKSAGLAARADGVEDPSFLTADEAEPIEIPPRTSPPADDSLEDFAGVPLPDLAECFMAENTIEAKFVADRLMEQGIPAVADTHDVNTVVGAGMAQGPRPPQGRGPGAGLGHRLPGAPQGEAGRRR